MKEEREIQLINKNNLYILLKVNFLTHHCFFVIFKIETKYLNIQ